MEHTENAITLRGQLTGLPEFSHENHGKRFCRFLLEVRPGCPGRRTCCPSWQRKLWSMTWTPAPGT